MRHTGTESVVNRGWYASLRLSMFPLFGIGLTDAFSMAKSRYCLAFLRSLRVSSGFFFPALSTYLTTLPRLKSRSHALMTLITSYTLSFPP